MDFTEKMQCCHDYVQGLEEERRKIQVFHRELPLCLQLVSQAIEACRQQLSENVHGGQSECSEQTMTTDGPVLEEFIPLNRSNSSFNDDEDEEHESFELDENSQDKNNNDMKKLDWLSSVQLWNQTPDPSPQENFSKRASVTEVKRNGGAFQPFHREKGVGQTNTSVGKIPSTVPATATSCTAETASVGGSSKKEEKERPAPRKERRCWSPELHRRFLHALQQLGGSHAATPKQIRELMKVDGLTNDEVKSHLQKYRLHTRRPSPTIQNNTNAQAPQFVVVGGIWVPPEYAAAVAATTAPGDAGSAAGAAAANGIYAPVAAPLPTAQASASLMQRLQQKKPEGSHSEEERGSHSEGGGVHSNSPASSSSTHTTASRGF